MTGLALLTSSAAIVVAGCSVPAEPALVLAGALVPFDACDDALSYLKGQALARVGPYGLDGGVQLYADERTEADTAAAAPVPGAAPGTAGGAADSGYSSTNVQEVGVDEPDIVKTDGEHIVSVVDGTLRVIDASAGREVGSLELTRSSRLPELAGSAELLLDGDRALVLVRQPMIWTDMPRAMPGWGPNATSRLIAVDLSDPAEPVAISSLDVTGDIVSARMVDGVARVALRSQPSIEFPWDETLADDEAALTARNRLLIEKSDLADWLPSATWTEGAIPTETGGAAPGDSELLVPCERLSYPPEFSGFATVSVLSLPIAGDLHEQDATGVLASGDTVYASADRFYVATNGWTTMPIPVDDLGLLPGLVPEVAQDVAGGLALGLTSEPATGLVAVAPGGGVVGGVDTTWTKIHAFDISAPGPARYLGSGEVAGRLIGQYALSAWEGNLRVASTVGASRGGDEPSQSRVTVLAEQGEGLVEIGRVDGLGTGEEIYAVRYAGPTAYVVTFRQTDPLYVIDLGDPTEPVVRGELEVTGYSGYLHPVGDGRMVGVGQQARDNGQTVGAQVSLFDVSDPTAPTKLAGHVVRNGWSEAEYEARAFLYWESSGRVVIPMSTDGRSGAVVLEVAGDDLNEVGWVEAADPASAAGTGESVRRSLVIGDRLFTLWSHGVQSNDLETLTGPTWIPFS